MTMNAMRNIRSYFFPGGEIFTGNAPIITVFLFVFWYPQPLHLFYCLIGD